MPKQVLIYGNDEVLVETRRIILAKAGYDAATVTERQEVRHLLSTREVDLLVLCSSLPNDVRKGTLSLSHDIRPERLNLVVLSGHIEKMQFSTVDVPFYAFDGPARFVKQVKSILPT